MKLRLLRWVGSLCLISLVAPVLATGFDDEYDRRPWQEMEVALPPAPKTADLQVFFVSAANPNRFSIDLASVQVGADGVVRYVLVVETPGGVRNVTYEGMRCETRERRIYAMGRQDGRWSKARNSAWQPVRDIPPARQHAALYADHFCPMGRLPETSDEVREALRRGFHPSSRPW